MSNARNANNLTAGNTIQRLAIVVRGVVQGVGFRPFIYNAARRCGLSGWVQNEADLVRIEVQGRQQQLDTFCRMLREGHPPQARLDSVEVSQVALRDEPDAQFEIRSSAAVSTPRPTIPADLATCTECLAEIRDPAERRYGYPFTNCTNCGPRWSIIGQLPYDRPRTSMAAFRMCAACSAEYHNPADRRFHAQPIACPECGPHLRFIGTEQEQVADCDEEAVRRTVAALRAGQIVALKGLGGFQLLVDATNAEAVARLRQRKRRPHKPFALMMADVDQVRRRCLLRKEEAEVLVSAQAPILLLRRRSDPDAVDDVAGEVAPGNPFLGVMLPHTPLHHLLMQSLARPLVCTSGNLSEEPMAVETDEAIERLGPIADVFLVHDRPIVRPVDDSVARWSPDGLQILRRARGYAPLPIRLPRAGPTILALGGHLKNTVALSLGDLVIVGSHIGDLDNVLSLEVHREAVADLLRFFDTVPDAVACDLHPDYATTHHAEQLAARWGVPLFRVQHHHAHVAACMAEHCLEGPVLGVAWDGTGYGPDGTVWGGEILLCHGAAIRRLAHLRQFPLPGGDKAVRQPRRSALGVLFELAGRDALRWAEPWFSPAELQLLAGAMERRVHSPRTSSAGRLFDAVAALCGLSAEISFEGQAAMQLEFLADAEHADAYPLPLSDTMPAVADWGPMIEALLADRRRGVPVSQIAARFHNALAHLVLAAARRWATGPVVLTGGCFQNALLTEKTVHLLRAEGLPVFLHHEVPPGDGGIALGQVLVAATQVEAARTDVHCD